MSKKLKEFLFFLIAIIMMATIVWIWNYFENSYDLPILADEIKEIK